MMAEAARPGAAGRLAGDWLIKGGGEALRKLLGFALATIAGRALGAGGFGEYTTAFTLTNMLALVVDFGLNTVLVREVARERRPAGPLFTTVLLLRSGLALALGAGLIAVAAMLRLPPRTAWTLYALTGFWIFSIGGETAAAVFAGQRQFQREAVVLISQKLLLALAGGMILGIGWGMIPFIAVHPLTAAAALVIAILYARRSGIAFTRPDRAMFRYFLAESFPLALSMAFTLLYFKVDILVLRWWSGAETVGYYGAAYRVMELAMALPATINAVLFPRIARRAATGSLRPVLKIWLPAAGLLGMATAAILAGLARPLVIVIFGTAFQPSARLLVLLAPALGLIFCNFPVMYSLIAIGRQRLNATLSALCLGINLLLNLVAIPFYGAAGAAVTTVVTELVLCAAGLYFLGEFTKVRRKENS
ncbi:flippase [bacterium]|nr:flippase [candidate division CSSED10-310 bacterium]